MTDSRSEESITRRVAQRLRESQWCVISVHFPGTQGGLRFRPRPALSKAAEAVIPDIVAARNACLLLLESKPEYCEADVEKLRNVKSDPRYEEDLRRAAAIAGEPLGRVITGVCFSGAAPAQTPDDCLLIRCTASRVLLVGGSSAQECLFE